MNVVFDVGNVLNEWNPVALVETHFAHALPAGMSSHDFVNAMLKEDWLAYDHGTLTTAELAARVSQKLGCDAIAFREFVEVIPHVLPVLDDSVAAVESLCDARDRGEQLRVFFLSNMPVEFAAILEKRFAWFARFDGGIFSGRAKLSKPNAAIYAALESQYALDPQRTLFLDDSAPNIRAAIARGWRTVHVNEPADVVRGLVAHGLLPVSTCRSL
jgi:putative hydrolase of the HAD superfamily